MQLISAPLSTKGRSRRANIDLSIIVPVFNEEQVLNVFHHELCRVVSTLTQSRVEIIYINDGSTDKSWAIMQTLTCLFADIHVVNLSRNFGKEAAMTAGFDYAKGDAVTILDADLQDPPSLLPMMLAKMEQGFDIINMKRRSRSGESFFKTFSAKQFYRLLQWLSDSPMASDVGDFRMLSKRVVEHLRALPERSRYMKGLMSWPGFKQTTLTFDRPKRRAGETKWPLIKLIGLALSGITAFSVKPLRLGIFAGSIVSLSAFVYGGWVGAKTLLFGEPVAGFPTLLLIQLFLGGVQLIAVGIVGEYVGRIFVESKGRPVYLVMDSDSKTALAFSEVKANG